MGSVRGAPWGTTNTIAPVRLYPTDTPDAPTLVLAHGAGAGHDHPWMRRVASAEGIAICPETAVCFDCLERLIQEGKVRRDDEIVVYNTGAAQKYPEAVPLALPRLDKNQPIRYAELV